MVSHSLMTNPHLPWQLKLMKFLSGAPGQNPSGNCTRELESSNRNLRRWSGHPSPSVSRPIVVDPESLVFRTVITTEFD